MLIAVLTLLVTASCSVSRFIPEDEYLLDHVRIRSTDKQLTTGQLNGYIQQHPNSKWFSLLKVPMSPYLISGTDTTKWINRFLHRVGQAPVIYDRRKAQLARNNIEAAVRNMGYLQAQVDLQERTRRYKMRTTYLIQPGPRYMVDSLERYSEDERIDSMLSAHADASLLRTGMPFDVNVLDAERNRVNTLLRNNGYYQFNKDFLRFEADTTQGGQRVWLRMCVDNYRVQHQQPRPHTQFTLANVELLSDTLLHRRTIRRNVLLAKNALRTGELYSEQDVRDTYANFSAMGAVMNSTINMRPLPEDSTQLEARVMVTTNKPHSMNVELEGTNSAGDLGAAVSVSYQNRNLMRGSELLNVKVRGAYEAIRGLDGYDDQDYIEYSGEVSLQFPDLKFPGVSPDFRRKAGAVSEVSLMYNSQDRPEFHRRVVTGAWRYRWYADSRKRQHRVDLLDLNYVFMPWISKTFREEYLENTSSRTSILRYNYENLFIMKWGYTLNISSQPLALTSGSYGTNAWNLRVAVETAGNLLNGITKALRTAKNEDGQYTLFNIAYAQYAKGDISFTKSFRFSPENSLAVHAGLGIAFPYGNGLVLPFEKRYFSGGANSVRGWSVRELGPGTFKGADGRTDFINQTGDMKLDLNLEYRAHLFWVIDGAAFIDAGNIWTLRNYEEQPGGQFRFDRFWREIAVAYGIGMRLNFNYFILRLDGGMKAVNPAYTDARRHYPIVHPRFRRDFALHFAVGLPF